MKIIVILGFVSFSKEKIKELFLVGVDVFCLNFSYGIYVDYIECFNIICEVEKEVGCFIGVLFDL